MKKFIAVFLLVFMALSLFVGCKHEKEAQPNYIAEVNGNKYESLQAAVDSLNTSKDVAPTEIKLLKDASGEGVKVDFPVNIKFNFGNFKYTFTGNVGMEFSKDATVEVKGGQLTVSPASNIPAIIKSEGTLTITDSTIDNSNKETVTTISVSGTSGSVTVSGDGNIKGSIEVKDSGATISFEGGTIEISEIILNEGIQKSSEAISFSHDVDIKIQDKEDAAQTLETLKDALEESNIQVKEIELPKALHTFEEKTIAAEASEYFPALILQICKECGAAGEARIPDGKNSTIAHEMTKNDKAFSISEKITLAAMIAKVTPEINALIEKVEALDTQATEVKAKTDKDPEPTIESVTGTIEITLDDGEVPQKKEEETVKLEAFSWKGSDFSFVDGVFAGKFTYNGTEYEIAADLTKSFDAQFFENKVLVEDEDLIDDLEDAVGEIAKKAQYKANKLTIAAKFLDESITASLSVDLKIEEGENAVMFEAKGLDLSVSALGVTFSFKSSEINYDFGGTDEGILESSISFAKGSCISISYESTTVSFTANENSEFELNIDIAYILGKIFSALFGSTAPEEDHSSFVFDFDATAMINVNSVSSVSARMKLVSATPTSNVLEAKVGDTKIEWDSFIVAMTPVIYPLIVDEEEVK